MHYSDHPQHLAAIRNTALRTADPFAAVIRNLRLSDSHLYAGTHAQPLHPDSRIILIALGKAASPMAIAAAAQLESRLVGGVAVVPIQHSGELPTSVNAIPAGHPHPDEGSLAAGEAAVELLRDTSKLDYVVVLISGGGSAMFEHPLPGITLDDLRTLNASLLHSGAPIEDINTVRRALSLVKAGGLARLAAPARCVALIMSDVVGDRLSTIASGPTVLRSANPEAARAILQQYALLDSTSQSVRAALSPKQASPPPAPRPITILVASNHAVVQAAQVQAEELGFPVKVLSRQMRGEARHVGQRIAKRLASATGPLCLLMGGETTVTVRGRGVGGRNQELALAASVILDGVENVALMSLATDGVDGPTDAAGAVVTGRTATQLRAARVDAEAALVANDSHTALHACGALVRMGPTQTNLNDLVVGLAYA
jgi:hydroxypyruvate reductase